MTLDPGFMQGRLSRVPEGVYQRFPDDWESELAIGEYHGFSSVEWIIDSYSESFNPLLSPSLHSQLATLKDYSIAVRSICADILLDRYQEANFSVLECYALLKTIITNASSVGISIIVLPFIENLSLRNPKLRALVVVLLNKLRQHCLLTHVKLALELDLPPHAICSLFQELDHTYVGINYDTGNSAAFGFDIESEFSAYSSLILDVHIKDRLLDGPSVLLGTGNANLAIAARLIKCLPRSPLIILQSYRNNYDTNLLIVQRDWFKYLLLVS
jgi:L-ribulose-5-phosphate 3-epimerase